MLRESAVLNQRDILASSKTVDPWPLIRVRVERAAGLLRVEPEQREDLEQHLCALLHRRVERCYDHRAPLVNYIDRTALLEAKKWLIRRRAVPEIPVNEPELLATPPAQDTNPGELWQRLGMTPEQAMERLEALASGLPPRQHNAWKAAQQRCHTDQSWREIALEFDEDPQRLMERWGQARLKLRRWLLDMSKEERE